jgi:hypothetical protein
MKSLHYKALKLTFAIAIVYTMSLLPVICPTTHAVSPTIRMHQGNFLPGASVILSGENFGIQGGRVVLGDKLSWKACTKKIDQEVLAWRSKRIIIKVTQGSYINGGIAFVYVIPYFWWFLPPTISYPYAITFGIGAGM